MARPRHVAAILMATAFIACSACVVRQANAQGGPERGSSGQLDSDIDRLDTYAQGDRLSNVKRLLRLSPDQEKLWAPVEEALVNISEQRRAFRSELSGDDRADQIERLRRRAELATRRGEALKKLADAVQPLWATLSDEQKRELMWSLAMGPSRGDQDRQMGYRRDDSERFRRPYRYDNNDRADRGWRDRDYSERRYRYPDGMRGYRNDDADDDDGMRRDRSDRSRWRSDDNDRPRWREFDRDRRDFDGRSGRDNCRCNRFD